MLLICADTAAHHLAEGTVDDLLPKVRNPLVSEELQRTIAWNLHRMDPITVDAAVTGALFDGFDPDTALPRIACPVHAVVARGDPLVTAVRDEDLERMVSLVSDFSFVLWEDTIHGIHYQRPDETTGEIASFLERVQKRRANRSSDEGGSGNG